MIDIDSLHIDCLRKFSLLREAEEKLLPPFNQSLAASTLEELGEDD